MSWHHLFDCYRLGKVDVFRYLFCLIFSDRSMYMQQKTGFFDAGFCKNTVYRFLNNAKTNWLRFTTLLSAKIINGFMKPLTSQEWKDVFIICKGMVVLDIPDTAISVHCLTEEICVYYRTMMKQRIYVCH